MDDKLINIKDFEWLMGNIRCLSFNDRYVKIRIPKGVTLDMEIVKGIFEFNDALVLSWLEDEQYIAGNIKSPELFMLMDSLASQHIKNRIQRIN